MSTVHPALSLRTPLEGAWSRLWCIAHAGGGASSFRAWREWLAPAGVELCPLQLPGREDRMRESPLRTLNDAVTELDDAVNSLPQLPGILLGHSMGALIAWRMALEWQRRDKQPVGRLIVSGLRSPSLRRAIDTHWLMTDSDFRHFLISQGGVPAELANTPALLDVFLPQIRADYTIVDCYVHDDPEKLALPADVLGGSDDPVAPLHQLQAWSDVLERTNIHTFTGDHFYLYAADEPFREKLIQLLRASAPVPS